MIDIGSSVVVGATFILVCLYRNALNFLNQQKSPHFNLLLVSKGCCIIFSWAWQK